MNLLSIFSSMFMFFLLVAWIWVLIGVIGDVFRSKDLGGAAKGIWALFIILIPWLGVLSYLIIRGQGMTGRNAQVLVEAEEMRRAYIQEAAGTSTADELTKLAALRDKGVITDAELQAQKAKLLG
jgi:hypothetical protein